MALPSSRVSITGAQVSFGRILAVKLSELQRLFVAEFVRGHDVAQLSVLDAQASAIAYLVAVQTMHALSEAAGKPAVVFSLPGVFCMCSR